MTVTLILDDMDPKNNPSASDLIQREIYRTRQAIQRFACNSDERADSLAQFERDLQEVADLALEDGKPPAPIIICRAYQHVFRS